MARLLSPHQIHSSERTTNGRFPYHGIQESVRLLHSTSKRTYEGTECTRFQLVGGSWPCENATLGVIHTFHAAKQVQFTLSHILEAEKTSTLSAATYSADVMCPGTLHLLDCYEYYWPEPACQPFNGPIVRQSR